MTKTSPTSRVEPVARNRSSSPSRSGHRSIYGSGGTRRSANEKAPPCGGASVFSKVLLARTGCAHFLLEGNKLVLPFASRLARRKVLRVLDIGVAVVDGSVSFSIPV